MPSLTTQKRPSGRYQVRLNLENGKTRTVGTFDLHREAKAAGAKALAEYRDGRLPGPRRLSLANYWLRYASSASRRREPEACREHQGGQADDLSRLHPSGSDRGASNVGS